LEEKMTQWEAGPKAPRASTTKPKKRTK